MFTGIVEAVGEVAALREERPGTYRLVLRTALAAGLKVGDSLANNGCCLTVITQNDDLIGFDLLAETATRTNLACLQPGDLVNLERPMAASSRFDGHIVQGHIDTTAALLAVERIGQDHRIQVELPKGFDRYIISKGSVALNGVSLTVAELHECSFVHWIIPHTWRVTNFCRFKPGQRVNLEFDLIAKYVERLLGEKRTGNYSGTT